jgi:hypothetical protein
MQTDKVSQQPENCENMPDILGLRTFIFPGKEQKAYVESLKECYIPFLVTLVSDAEAITWSLNG